MSFIRRQYKQIFYYFCKNIKKIFLVMLVVSAVIIFLVTFITLNLDLDIARLGSKLSGISKDVAGNGTFLGILVSNLRANFLSLITGIIPFVFIPILYFGVNNFVLGFVLGLGQKAANISFFKLFVFGILPHGVIELPINLLTQVMGVYLCIMVTKCVRKKISKNELKDACICLLKTFVFFEIPCLVIAAFIETNLTPLIMDFFL